MRLLALLSSLADATRADDMELELIVVDDGSRDGTADAVKRFASTVGFPVRLLQKAGRGLAAARNLGMREASGGLLLFLDDDCVVSRSYLTETAARFAGDHRPVLRGGCVALGDLADARLTIKTAPRVERLREHRDPAGFILGCNMAMSRAVACKIGLFDERFGAGGLLRAAEDTDYVLRAQLAGVTVEYVPDMIVYHHHGRRSSHEVGRAHRNYCIGEGALTMKHTLRAPWLWRLRYWTARNAVREMFGGPRFNPELGLSHAPVVAHNLIGACLFALVKITGVAAWPRSAALEVGSPVLPDLRQRHLRPAPRTRSPEVPFDTSQEP
jgi:glycosyltransferase involved in cell wall biosynthesis